MYTAIEGIFENGQITLREQPPTAHKARVVVMFLDQDEVTPAPAPRMRRPGSLLCLGQQQGRVFSLPDDFNAPLSDLAEYMQ